MVARGEREQGYFIVARHGALLARTRLQHRTAAEPGGPVNHPGLAEPAAAHAAAEQLQRDAVVYGLDQRHDRLLRDKTAVHIQHHGAAHRRLRRDARNCGAVILHRIQRRDIRALDGGRAAQKFLSGHALPLARREQVQNGGNAVLAVADEHKVEKRSDRLAVDNAGAARYDERVVLPALGRIERNAAQLHHLQDTGVVELELEAEAHNVEL